MKLHSCILRWCNPSDHTMALGVDSSSNRDEYPGYSAGVKGGQCIGLTISLPACADCLENMGPSASWSLIGLSIPVWGLLLLHSANVFISGKSQSLFQGRQDEPQSQCWCFRMEEKICLRCWELNPDLSVIQPVALSLYYMQCCSSSCVYSYLLNDGIIWNVWEVHC
jgi:hypothetical protein